MQQPSLSVALLLLVSACGPSRAPESPRVHVVRLLPGDDLRQGIAEVARSRDIRAGWIETCVGSLTKLNLRYANQPEGSAREGHFEIVSLTGTVSVNGSHLHLAASDGTGATVGGHLLEGNIVFTTAELVIGEDPSLELTREEDGTTPWKELQIRERAR